MKKLLTLLAVGSIAFGVVSAAAASLGTVSKNGLGASTQSVAACDTDGFNVTYGTDYSSGQVAYWVTNVKLGSSDTDGSTADVNSACDGKTAVIDVVGAGGTSLESTTGTVALTNGTQTFNLAKLNYSAGDVVNVAVLIKD